MELPLLASRKGTVLGFNATTGAAEAGPTIANVNSLSAITANINTVAGISANVTTVAGIQANVSTVAGISSAVSTVAGISSAVSAVNSNATNINAVNSNSSNINTVAGAATNINTVATNVSGVNSFAERYRVQAGVPSSSNDVGDLVFDTAANTLKVFGSSGFQNAGSSVNGTSERFTYNITGTPTTLTGASGTGFAEAGGKTLAYDAGFLDVYLNGVRLITGTDYTQTNSTTITLASGATAGDEIETVAWKSLGDVVNIASLNTAGNLTVTGVATATGGFVGNLTGNVTGNVSGSSGSTTGNAATATALQNARTIGGVSFDGTANINLPGVNQSGTQDTSGNAATATVGTTITVSDESSDTTCFPLFATAATGNLGAKSGSNLTFNSDTGALSATSFAGSGSGLTAGTTPITTLDIDGGTATSTLASGDLFIVDDGANGTNRKVTFQTISDAVLGGSGGATFAAINVTGIGTFGGVLDSNGGANISGGDGLVASSAKVSDLTNGRVVLAGASGELEDSGNLTFNGSALTVTGTANVTSNLTVGGDLTVNGTTTQINTVNTTIEDTLLELQKVDGGNLGSDTNKDVGIVMNYYDGSAKKAAFFWDDSAGRFAFGSVVTETSGVLGSVTYGGVEIGALHVNDCAGASQVISCSGTTRSLENITIDGGSF